MLREIVMIALNVGVIWCREPQRKDQIQEQGFWDAHGSRNAVEYGKILPCSPPLPHRHEPTSRSCDSFFGKRPHPCILFACRSSIPWYPTRSGILIRSYLNGIARKQ